MAGSRFAVAWPDNYVTATIATFVAGRLFSGDGGAPRGAGPDEYEVTATLKVRGDDLEEVVARTFADPHCVDVRVQSARWLAYPSDEGDG